MIRFICYFVLILFFGGCATKIDMTQYKDIPQKRQIEIKAIKHSIAPQNIRLLNGHNRLDDYAYSTFGSVLSSSGVFDFVSDGGAIEIDLYFDELSSDASFVPSEWVQTGVQTREVIDKRTGAKSVITVPQGYYTKPYWEHDVYAQLSLKVRNKHNNTSQLYSKNSTILYKQYSSYHQKSDVPEYALRDAINNTIYKLVKDVQNDHSAVGNIVGVKQNIEDTNKKIYMINLGRNYGIYQEQKIEIYTKYGVEYATVSNQILPNSAWIVPQNEEGSNIDIGNNAFMIFR